MDPKPNIELGGEKASVIASIKAIASPQAISAWFSSESLTKKASLNALSSGLDYAARLIVGFVINPILLSGLGDFYYGVWQFLGRLIGYISPATGRPTQALKWTIARDQASTDFEAKRLEVGKAVYVWVLFLPVIAILGGVMVWLSPLLLGTTAEISPGIRLSTALLVANTAMVSIVGIPRSVLEGENLSYKRMGLSAALVFAGGGLMVLATYLGFGIGGVSAAKLATTLLTGLLFIQIVRSYVPWFGLARPTWESVRSYVGLSGWFIGWNLVMRMLTASDVLVLGIINSPEMVTSYTLIKYVPETIVNIIAMFIQGVIPGVGGVLGSGDIKKTARIRSELMTYTWLILTILGATVLMWNQSFLHLWVGSDYSADSIQTLMIILMIIQFVLIRNDAYLIDLTLDLRRKVTIGLVSATLSIAIASILVGYLEMGIVGLCLGFILGRSIMSIVFPRLVGKLLNVSPGNQVISIIRPLLSTTLIFFLIIRAQRYWVMVTWFDLVLSVILSLVFITVFTVFMGLNASQRNRIWKRAQYLVNPE